MPHTAHYNPFEDDDCLVEDEEEIKIEEERRNRKAREVGMRPLVEPKDSKGKRIYSVKNRQGVKSQLDELENQEVPKWYHPLDKLRFIAEKGIRKLWLDEYERNEQKKAKFDEDLTKQEEIYKEKRANAAEKARQGEFNTTSKKATSIVNEMDKDAAEKEKERQKDLKQAMERWEEGQKERNKRIDEVLKNAKKEREEAPVSVTRNWRRRPEFAKLAAVLDPTSEEGQRQGELLDKYFNKDYTTDKEDKQIKKILKKVKKQRNANYTERQKAVDKLIDRGLTYDEALAKTRHLVEVDDTFTDKLLDRFHQQMDKFKRSSWNQTKIGKTISDFHTHHGDAVTLGTGAAIAAGTGLAAYGLYKGVKKLFGKKKEEKKEEEEEPKIQSIIVPVYNTMPLEANQDKGNYPYPFPMSDSDQQLPPQYYAQGASAGTQKIRIQ